MPPVVAVAFVRMPLVPCQPTQMSTMPTGAFVPCSGCARRMRASMVYSKLGTIPSTSTVDVKFPLRVTLNQRRVGVPFSLRPNLGPPIKSSVASGAASGPQSIA